MSLRAHERYPIKARVRLSWEDGDGHPRQCNGHCVDIGECGIGLIVDDPIPLRHYVGFRIPAIDLHGSGSVRFVKRRGLRHFLGIEFSGTTRWSPDTHPIPSTEGDRKSAG